MRIKSIGLIVVAALFAVMVVPTLVSAAAVEMEAKLKGSEEPGGGEQGGKGTAVILANKKKEKVCFELTYKRIGTPFAAHIHKGKAGVNGDIVVPLIEDQQGFPSGVTGCVKRVDSDLIRKMTRKPQNYYVNLHNGDFPGGAIRGQLSIEASG